MKNIVERGYAIPKEEITRLMDELRKKRAAEWANASEEERARIEKEIRMELKWKIFPREKTARGAPLRQLVEKFMAFTKKSPTQKKRKSK